MSRCESDVHLMSSDCPSHPCLEGLGFQIKALTICTWEKRTLAHMLAAVRLLMQLSFFVHA